MKYGVESMHTGHAGNSLSEGVQELSVVYYVILLTQIGKDSIRRDMK